MSAFCLHRILRLPFFAAQLFVACCVAASLGAIASTASAQSAIYPDAPSTKMLRVSYPESSSVQSDAKDTGKFDSGKSDSGKSDSGKSDDGISGTRETVTAEPLDEPIQGQNFSTTAMEPSDVMLQKEIDTLDAEREILRVQLGDSHPNIQVFDARIKAAEKALAKMRRRKTSGNGTSGNVTSGNVADRGDDEPFPAASAAISDSEMQSSIEQLQRVVRILAERVIALEAEVANLKQRS